MLPSQGYSVTQWVKYEDKDETNKWECQAHVISMDDDKNCQSTKSIHMQPVQSAMKSSYMSSVMKSSHVWSVQPAMTQSTNKQCSQVRPVSLCGNKNCQSTKKNSYEECQVDQCVMTRTVNLSSVCICRQWYQHCHNLPTRNWHNQLICSQHQRLLGNRLAQSLK